MITTDADRLYGGSLERWGRLANSLKLRLAMRIVYTDFTTDDGRTPQQLAEEAVSSELGVIEDNSGNAMYTGFGKDGNPFYVCFFSYKSGAGDHRVAADIASFMNGYADPRRASYFNESAFAAGGYAGLRNGIQIPDDERINNFSRYNVTASTSLMWMNASEVAFLRAEGALRGWAMGGDARSFYEEGIRLSFERCGVADQLTGLRRRFRAAMTTRHSATAVRTSRRSRFLGTTGRLSKRTSNASSPRSGSPTSRWVPKRGPITVVRAIRVCSRWWSTTIPTSPICSWAPDV